VVKSGPVPGILAYAGKRPVGWCAIAPRGATLVETYPRDKPASPLQAMTVHAGLATAFARRGFTEAARRSKIRPVMRRAA
jgi:hypothetical protein